MNYLLPLLQRILGHLRPRYPMNAYESSTIIAEGSPSIILDFSVCDEIKVFFFLPQGLILTVQSKMNNYDENCSLQQWWRIRTPYEYFDT